MAEGGEGGVVLCPGPREGVSYPLSVRYCGECSLPLEYCAHGPCPERCRKWLEENLPDMVEEVRGSVPSLELC